MVVSPPTPTPTTPPIHLKHLFERVVCINLDRRRRRWLEFQKRLDDIDWPFVEVRRFSAVDGRRVPAPNWWRAGHGAWGCHQSHVQILQQALQDKVRSLLILEDDACFLEDFLPRLNQFVQQVPHDWDGLMLGGQHLCPAERVNEHVLRVRNGNRTHAHALRGTYINAAYKHLCNYPSHARAPHQHVDHRFGRLHESGRFKIYAPSRWLIGQAEDFSNIRGAQLPARSWAGSIRIRPTQDEHLAPPKQNVPIIAVLGLIRGGSSCTAGVLYHLGVHVGRYIRKGDQHNPSGYFEPRWLSQQLQRMYSDPKLSAWWPRRRRLNILRQWYESQSQLAAEKNAVLGVKHPFLCLAGEDLEEAWGHALKRIAVYRPLEESLGSLKRAGWFRPRRRRELLERLWNEREKYLADHEALRFQYHDLLADPAEQVRRISAYLDLSPTPEQFEAACAFVDPKLQHMRSSS